jgi:two-component sensor histidine kinase
MRTRFTSDMHDTISHSLTTESAIIRTLAKESDSETADRLLAELALVNAEATKRLRQLVTSLSKWETEACTGDSATSRVRFRAEAEQLSTAIEDGCAAGSVPLTTELSPLPTHATGTLSHHFRAVMLELATNVIRHSVPGTPATLAVEMRGERGDRAELLCRSTNESPTALTQAPRSLSRRAKAVGGVCRVDADDRKRTVVEVALPIRFISPSAQATSAADMIDVVDDDFETGAVTSSTEAPNDAAAGDESPHVQAPSAGAPTTDRSADSVPDTGGATDYRSQGRRKKGDRDKVDA